MTRRPRWLLVALLTAAGGCSGANAPPDGADAPPACTGDNPALRCRAAPDDCIPSGCTCSGSGWACTADCSGGRSCGDAGAD